MFVEKYNYKMLIVNPIELVAPMKMESLLSHVHHMSLI